MPVFYPHFGQDLEWFSCLLLLLQETAKSKERLINTDAWEGLSGFTLLCFTHPFFLPKAKGITILLAQLATFHHASLLQEPALPPLPLQSSVSIFCCFLLSPTTGISFPILQPSPRLTLRLSCL